MNSFKAEQLANQKLLDVVSNESAPMFARRDAYIGLYQRGMTQARIVELSGVVFLDLFPERHTNVVHFPQTLPTKEDYGRAVSPHVGK
jgi:hypothetical protein